MHKDQFTLRRLSHSIKKRIAKIKRTALTPLYGRMRPTAMVIGAQKSGTSALYFYLSQHPDVVPSLKKELNYFSCDNIYSKGEEAYLNFFEVNTPGNQRKITVDVTPGYLFDADISAPRICQFNPKIRLIVTLRDPVTRAFSAWQMYKKLYDKNPDWYAQWMVKYHAQSYRDQYQKRKHYGRSFLEDIEQELEAIKNNSRIELSVLDYGLYAQQLRVFLGYFSKEQLLVIDSRDFKNNTQNCLAYIESYLGLAPHDWALSNTSPQFEGGYSQRLTDQEKNVLREFYQPHNRQLYDLLGKDFNWL